MEFISRLNFINIYIFVTMLMAFALLDRKKDHNVVLLSILVSAVLCEIACTLLLIRGKSIELTANIYFPLTILQWFTIFYLIVKKRIILMTAAVFLAIAIAMLIIDGYDKLNFYTLVAGALLYVYLLLYISVAEIKKDNLGFFARNQYLLIAAPVVFFIGLSLIYGFRTGALYRLLVAGIKLFTLVSFISNIVYYSLINYYLYRERTGR